MTDNDELVERVAIAMADRSHFTWNTLSDIPYSIFDLPQGSKQYWRDLARAALAVMRDEVGE